jgi:hypothetical protein
MPQLNMGNGPFFLDFGDASTGHLFFDTTSDKAYFM